MIIKKKERNKLNSKVRKCMKYYLSNHLMESDFGKLYFKINV